MTKSSVLSSLPDSVEKPLLLSARAADLGRIRAAIFCVATVYVALLPLEPFSAFSPEIHERIGLVSLAPHSVWSFLHTPLVLNAFQLTLTVGLFFCALGTRGYRMVAPACALLFVLHQSLIRIDESGHRELSLLYSVLLLASLPAADGFSIGSGEPAPGRKGYQAAIYVLAAVFLLPYSFTGLYRLAHGAPTVFVDDTILHLLVGNGSAMRNGLFSFDYGQQLVSLGEWAPLLMKGGYVVGTVMEVLAPVALVSRRFGLAWLVFVVAFHGLNLLFLNIEFFANMLLAPVLLLSLWHVLKHERQNAWEPTES